MLKSCTLAYVASLLDSSYLLSLTSSRCARSKYHYNRRCFSNSLSKYKTRIPSQSLNGSGGALEGRQNVFGGIGG